MSPDLSTPSGTPVEPREHTPSPLKVVNILEEKVDKGRTEQNPMIQHLKNLLSESHEDCVQAEGGPDENEMTDESSKICVSPDGQLVVEGKEMMTPRSLTDSLTKSKLETTLLNE